jgi:CMP-N-acetylneuraminic acid synthetase
LAGDEVLSLPVVQHAVDEMEKRRGDKYDFVILLQATAPLCRTEDIKACITKLANDPDCDSVVAVVPVTTHPFKMKRIVNKDTLINFIDQGFEDMRPRQELPVVYRRAGSVYVNRRDVVMEHDNMVSDNCRAVIVPSETAIDIDTMEDLELVKILISRKKECEC